MGCFAQNFSLLSKQEVLLFHFRQTMNSLSLTLLFSLLFLSLLSSSSATPSKHNYFNRTHCPDLFDPTQCPDGPCACLKGPLSLSLIRLIFFLSLNTHALSLSLTCILILLLGSREGWPRRCRADVGLVDYMKLYFCHFASSPLGPIFQVLYVVWTFLLFLLLLHITRSFFVMSLSRMSERLKISNSVAGVTFISFGNGATDVVSGLCACERETERQKERRREKQ
jgi:hypothetical protein